MKLDYADVGNISLGIGGAVSVYLAAKGFVAEAVLIASLVGVVKAFCSAVDNYQYKKSVAQP